MSESDGQLASIGAHPKLVCDLWNMRACFLHVEGAGDGPRELCCARCVCARSWRFTAVTDKRHHTCILSLMISLSGTSNSCMGRSKEQEEEPLVEVLC